MNMKHLPLNRETCVRRVVRQKLWLITEQGKRGDLPLTTIMIVAHQKSLVGNVFGAFCANHVIKLWDC